MIITITGKPGSGKTTVAKALAEKLGFKHYSVGDMRGQLATEKGMTIDELNEIGKKEDWTDKEIDNRIAELGKSSDNLVVDGYMAWHFIPNSIKIFFDVDLKVAAERIFKNQRPDEKHQDNVDDVYEMINNRMENNLERYKKWYDIDLHDLSQYDLLIDTSDLTFEQCMDTVLEFIKKDLKTE